MLINNVKPVHSLTRDNTMEIGVMLRLGIIDLVQKKNLILDFSICI